MSCDITNSKEQRKHATEKVFLKKIWSRQSPITEKPLAKAEFCVMRDP
jgi:hypothetical protein